MNRKVNLGTTVLLCVLSAVVAFMSAWTITRIDYKMQMNEMYLKYPEAVKLMEVMKYFEENYVGELDEELLEEAVLKGYVSATGDRYGTYYTPDEYRTLLKEDNGELVGIGVFVSYEDERGISIQWVMPDSPAQKGGLKKGDLIIGVDGKSEGYTNKELSQMIAGKEGTEVTLSILSDGEEKELTLKRATVVMDSVFSQYIEDEKIGFIRIFTFDNTTPEQFRNALKKMKAEGAESFIFDLRNNGGGLMSSLMEVLGSLLPDNSLYATANFKDGTVKEYKVKNGSEFDYPAVVLMNRNTASAAELFTAALKDYGVVTTVGENSFGKGIMQSIVSLRDGSALKLTTAYYQSPNGKNYDGKGLAPDIEADPGDDYIIKSFELDMDDPTVSAGINALKENKGQ